jgi:hypothetical protein
MFGNGIATRSKFKTTPRIHIVTTTTERPATYCTSAPALVENPVSINVDKRLCPLCLAEVRATDDGDDILREVGWPWPQPIGQVSDSPSPSEERRS